MKGRTNLSTVYNYDVSRSLMSASEPGVVVGGSQAAINLHYYLHYYGNTFPSIFRGSLLLTKEIRLFGTACVLGGNLLWRPTGPPVPRLLINGFTFPSEPLGLL
jgi:hypothetical protein